MSTSNDGSESVDQFLARIASVKSGRDEADEARTRRMEEEILKSRAERQAKRAERARSLSPSKTGPARTTFASINGKPIQSQSIHPPVEFSPRAQPQPLSRSNAVSLRTSPTLEPAQEVVKELPLPPSNASPSLAQSSGANTLSRSGTLSWQQRPISRDGELTSRSRPLSAFSSIRTILPEEPARGGQVDEPSRSDIAAFLGEKDPAWFRQTQDRAKASAAYRKTQVEDSPKDMPNIQSIRLHGLSRDSAAMGRNVRAEDPEQESRSKESSPEPSRNYDRLRRGDTPDMVAMRNSMTTPILAPKPVFESPKNPREATASGEGTSDTPVGRSPTITPTVGRSPSPTKGLGGFVQSAMMKRSDSVSKRWSVQANAGLKRGDSIASVRPTASLVSSHARSPSREPEKSFDGAPSSPLVSSRPTSSHSSKIFTSMPLTHTERPMSITLKPEPDAVESSFKVEEQHPATEEISTGSPAGRPSTPGDDSELSRSPSKTMDSRRWSPTKSSWLESALLAKPDQPKFQPLKEEVPSWRVELQRAKANRDASPEKNSNPLSRETVRAPDFAKPTPISRPERPLSINLKSKLHNEPVKQPSLQGTVMTDVSKPAQPSQGSTDADKTHTNTLGNNSGTEIKGQHPKAQKSHESFNNTPEPESLENLTIPASKKPPVIKPKPQTPPKTDFRSTLKSRSDGPAQSSSAEPEFKSVFGKLKRATTQNYVAPDELKNNILHGKAALAVTDGPQKTKRVDEFKENILAKKEAMKTNPMSSSQKLDTKEKPELLVPEALARRKTLSKASAAAHSTSDSGDSSLTEKPEARPSVAPKPKVTVSIAKAVAPSTPSSKLETSKDAVKSTSLQAVGSSRDLSAGQNDSKKETIGGRGGSKISPTNSTESPARDANESSLPQTTKSPVVGELSTAGKLASRLNPNLATILSRGNSPRPAMSQENSSGTVPRIAVTQTLSLGEHNDSASTNLTHMTKGRAKGPKRRAPKSDNSTSQPIVKEVPSEAQSGAEETSSGPGSIQPQPASLGRQASALANSNGISPILTITAVKPIARKSESSGGDEPSAVSSEKSVLRAKPMIAAKSPDLRKVSNPIQPQPRSATPITPNKSVVTKGFEVLPDQKASVLLSSETRNIEESENKKSDGRIPLLPSKTILNSPKQPIAVSQQPTKPSSPKPVVDLGIDRKGVTSRPQITPKKDHTRVTKPENQAGRLDKVLSGQQTNGHDAKLSDYLSTPLDIKEKADFDTHAFLQKPRSDTEKIKTLQMNIWELSGDGKKSSMPPQQEHILFEESMYLIIHQFEVGNKSKTSDVYLWCGDKVAEAAMEDIQIFCRKDAREQGTKLSVLRQGKEPARFFQALGGIVITRRSKTSSFYMLCGRRHMGHVAFDEVDMSADSLCPGYAFIISAQYGKLYLWNGNGSVADEVGCARLIGMDLGLTGEIEEIAQGAEPDSFWAVFPSRPRFEWSADWQRRGQHDGYPCALYRVEHDRVKSGGGFWGLRASSPPKSAIKAVVEEIVPFCQKDLDAPQIHILDTYRSVYVKQRNPISICRDDYLNANCTGDRDAFAFDTGSATASVMLRRIWYATTGRSGQLSKVEFFSDLSIFNIFIM